MGGARRRAHGLGSGEGGGGVKRCALCRKWKDRADFHHTTRWESGRRKRYANAYCKPCATRQTDEKRKRWRDELRKLKDGKSCELCGWNEDPQLLHYDHLDPSTKVGDVSVLVSAGSPRKARIEIAKCRLLCPTCHAKHTAEQRRAGLFSGPTKPAATVEIPNEPENLDLFGETA
jgi:hypothetical protein